jgi:AcrR family transcriptional regulator
MARTINAEEYAEKRSEILNVMQRLVYTRGYAQMTIQDILTELRISKGAFYHYFDSKHALLEALVERMMNEAEAMTQAIVDDPQLSAVEKFRQFFSSVIAWKEAQKGFVVELLRVWFADDNALVRHKVNVQMNQRISPLFAAIIRQGIDEKVFSTPYPDQAAEAVLATLIGLQSSIAGLLFESELSEDPQQQKIAMVTLYAAFVDAMERILGAPEGALPRISAESIQVWIDALREKPVQPEQGS